MKIYTRTGDKGKTSLYGGKRVFKNDLRIDAYGSIDELNSVLGVVLSETKDKKLNTIIKQIQTNLFFIGSLLAGYKPKIFHFKFLILNLERLIDNFEKELPELRNFLLPGGTKVASLLHLGRSVCRRAERRVVELVQKENPGVSRENHPRGGIRFTPQDINGEQIIIYLNRLSDLLFEMARWENLKAGKKEIVWKI